MAQEIGKVVDDKLQNLEKERRRRERLGELEEKITDLEGEIYNRSILLEQTKDQLAPVRIQQKQLLENGQTFQVEFEEDKEYENN